jgi:hypothetical protein
MNSSSGESSSRETNYGLGNARRRWTPRQSAASAAFSVALGRIAADVLAESGR